LAHATEITLKITNSSKPCSYYFTECCAICGKKNEILVDNK
jgi:hypothetical protein